MKRKLITGEIVDLTAEEIAMRQADESMFQRDLYKHQRAAAYGSIAEQMDMQYWDSINSTTTWKDHIASVKAAFPKP